MWELRQVPVWKDNAILKDENGNTVMKNQWRLETAEARYTADGEYTEEQLNTIAFSETTFHTADGRKVYTPNAFGKLIKTAKAEQVTVSKHVAFAKVKVIELE